MPMYLFYNTVHIAPPPRDMLQTPPTNQPTVPEVQSTPPPRGMLQMPPTSQPNIPKVPDNKAPLSAPIAPGTVCIVILIHSCNFCLYSYS